MDILQIGGGLILCAGYVPQIRRIIATRSAHDLSLTMWLSVLAGLVLMEIYAVGLFVTAGTTALLVTNSLSLAFSIAMVWLIFTYGTRPAWATLRPLRANLRPTASAPVVALIEVENAA